MTDRRSAFPPGSGNTPVRRSTRPPTTGAQRTSSGTPRTSSGTQRTQGAPRSTGAIRTTGNGAPRSGTTRTTGRPPSVQPRGGNGGPRGPRDGDSPEEEWPRWRRILKQVGIWSLVAGLAVGVIGFFVLAIWYSRIEVPAPSDFAAAESSTIYYADQTTVMARLGVADREIVDFDTLPEHVGHVFIAAEDRSFETNPGVDIVGTGRALFRTVVQGKQQGGSTITQQYVERYYVGETTTSIKGKIEEALMALKIDSEQEKQEILGNYVNTIYFGRGAYGIQAASRQYFQKDAVDLTVSEAALLAGIIPAPSAWDPRLSPEQAELRWNYVLDGMVAIGELDPAERLRQTFPEVAEYRNDDVYGGPQGHLIRAAIVELTERTEITEEQIETRGLQIYTTIDPVHQQAAVAAVAQIPEGHAPNLRVAAMTMNPQTGAITSMYGGADYLQVQRNAVTQDIAQAGSTFKPFALVAALQQGMSLESEYVANHNMTLPGFENPVRNFGSVNFGQIDLVRATQDSVNTAYVQLANDVGADAVMKAAIDAGIPADTVGLDTNPSNVLGTASPHALDMASAYATFAANGMSTEPFMVASVVDGDGNQVYVHEVVQTRVFEADVMAETSYALTRVVQAGSGAFARELGRPVAGKTGTANENRSAWFVGYTPDVVGVVSMYQVGEDGSAEAITPFGGFSQITGGTVPVRLWTWMMGPILDSIAEHTPFPARTFIGESNIPEPEPSPTPEPEPSPSPSPSPLPEPSPPPAPEPSPAPSPTAIVEMLLKP